MINERLDSFLMVNNARKDDVYYLCDSGSKLRGKQVKVITDADGRRKCTVETVTAPIVSEGTYVCLLEKAYQPTPSLQKRDRVASRDDESMYYGQPGTIISDVQVGKLFRVQLDSSGETIELFSKEATTL